MCISKKTLHDSPVQTAELCQNKNSENTIMH